MITGESSVLWWGVCCGVVAVEYARYNFFQAEGHTRGIPSLSLNTCKDKRSPTEGQPALFFNSSHCFALNKSAFLQGSLRAAWSMFWGDKETVPCPSSCGLAHIKLCSSLLFCGRGGRSLLLNIPASHHFSRDLKANTLPFSSAASLFKKCYQFPPFKTNWTKSTLWNIIDLSEVLVD